MLWPGVPLAEALGTKQHEYVLVLVQANRLASPRLGSSPDVGRSKTPTLVPQAPLQH